MIVFCCVLPASNKARDDDDDDDDDDESWLPLLRPSIPIGWRLRLLRDFTTDLQPARTKH